MAVSKCPCSTFSNAMFKQMPRSHWFLSINSQYLQPYWLLQQTSEHAKLQRYKATKIHMLTPLTYELFFQNSSIMKWGIKKLIDDVHSKYSGLLALLSGEPISASAKTSNSFCLRGLCPLDPQRGAAPVPCGGPRLPPDPSSPGGPPAPSAAYSL